MKASLHVSSDKSLRLRESKAIGRNAFLKKSKAGEKKFCLDFFNWFVSYKLSFPLERRTPV